MDSVQQFIANNLHQLGYIMQEASRQWSEKDPLGALTVGPCKGTIDVNGSYFELLDKLESIQKGNVHACSIEVDTREADESIKELTTIANECANALEKLEKVMGRFENKPMHVINFNPVIKTELSAKELAKSIQKLVDNQTRCMGSK
ncbi:hypothetical protein [Bacillus thuringiensis]|uniref:hypothetical protein n=1 Tax=Bacillus thuringiensis TaxID=1428 RepID=UPI000B2D1345|nr:hypothetical protein [Bacillus thuringiensis]